MSWKKFSSGEQANSVTIYDGPCFYFGFSAKTGGEGFDINIFDNTANTGAVIEAYTTDANKVMESVLHASPIACRNGIYLEIANGSAIVYYTPLREGVQ